MAELQGIVEIIQAFFNALKRLFDALTGKVSENTSEATTGE